VPISHPGTAGVEPSDDSDRTRQTKRFQREGAACKPRTLCVLTRAPRPAACLLYSL
jgi:hypothetical protein